MFRTITILAVTLLLGSVVTAQNPGYAVVIPAPGTQQNSPNASLLSSGYMTENGAPSPNSTILGPASPSTSLCWVSGPNLPPSNQVFTQTLTVTGLPGQPLILAATFTLGQFICGGFAGAPCATGPYFPNAIPTPFGQYHLDFPPIGIIDSVGVLGGVNLTLDAAGQLGFTISYPFSNTAPWGTGHVTFQGLVLDPAAPLGYTFTAACSIVDWQFFF